jgi:hypothetical protein
VSVWFVAGPAIAAVFGALTISGGRAGWAFWLARPVRRRALMLFRALADVLLLLLMATGFLLLAGRVDVTSQWPVTSWLLIPGLWLWPLAHAAGMWSASADLGPLRSLGLAPLMLALAGIMGTAGLVVGVHALDDRPPGVFRAPAALAITLTIPLAWITAWRAYARVPRRLRLPSLLGQLAVVVFVTMALVGQVAVNWWPLSVDYLECLGTVPGGDVLLRSGTPYPVPYLDVLVRWSPTRVSVGGGACGRGIGASGLLQAAAADCSWRVGSN